MYSYEITNLVNHANHIIASKDYIQIIRTSPQIDHVIYDPFSQTTDLWTNDNYHWNIKIYKSF